jgi:DNA polymerase
MIPARDAANVLRWWADAGVDTLVDEAAVPWIERAKARQPARGASEGAPLPAQSLLLPKSLPLFIDWLMLPENLAMAGPASQRLRPAGNAQADLMVLLDMPEAGDAAAGKLLSGEVGALFDAMLKAVARDRSQIWLGALLPGRSPTGLIDAAALPQLTEIARHHIALIAPKRLWILGETTSRALLATDLPSARGRKHIFNHEGCTTEAVASFHPRFLLQQPARKKSAWEDMQLLIEGL